MLNLQKSVANGMPTFTLDMIMAHAAIKGTVQRDGSGQN